MMWPYGCFADGICDDLITQLSYFREFAVISRNSTLAYKGAAPDPRQLSRDLGVRYIVEGSVRRAGDRITVNAQLIDAWTGQHVWAERYDRPYTNVFELQDDLTHAIAASMEPEVGHYQTERSHRRSSVKQSIARSP